MQTIAQFICQICSAKDFANLLWELWFSANAATTPPGSSTSFFISQVAHKWWLREHRIKEKRNKITRGFSCQSFQFYHLKLILFPFHWFCLFERNSLFNGNLEANRRSKKVPLSFLVLTVIFTDLQV